MSKRKTKLEIIKQVVKEIGTEVKTIQASCLEDFYRRAVKDHGFKLHDLHFHTRDDDYLYLIRIANRYDNKELNDR